MENTRPHSAEWVTASSRDFWWNDDFLALMARRWRLAACTSILDVGSGRGHWGQQLLPHCAAGARLQGVEREPRWVADAGERAARLGLAGRATYRVGLAESLPFDDATFDLVTCQTLLLHVRDPLVVLREMRRVVHPGGLVALVEPVNQASSLMLGSTRFGDDVGELVELLRFELTCYRGKARLGEGDNSVGSLLPRLCHAAGLVELEAFQSDKASLLVPPYDSPEARALVAEASDQASRDYWIWDRADTLRYFVAGGGVEADFDGLLEQALAAARRVAGAMKRGEELAVGSGVMFLVSGRRPIAA